MKETELELISTQSKNDVCSQLIAQAEGSLIVAKINYEAALAALEAIRNERNSLLAPKAEHKE